MNSDVYVCFTTHESRVQKIGPMLNSLLGQWPGEKVVLSVAHELSLPSFVADAGCRIVRCYDSGPFKKHSPTFLDLDIERYIVIDDDIVYPVGWFDNLIEWGERLRGHCICHTGMIWRCSDDIRYQDGQRILANRVKKPTLCSSYVGSGGAYFETSFFDKSLIKLTPSVIETTADDLLFSSWLQHGVQIYVVPFCGQDYGEGVSWVTELPYAKDSSALWLSQHATDYQKWNKVLHNVGARLCDNTSSISADSTGE